MQRVSLTRLILSPCQRLFLTESYHRELGLRTTSTKNLSRGFCHDNPTGTGERPVFAVHTENLDLGPRSESHIKRNYTRRMAYEAG